MFPDEREVKLNDEASKGLARGVNILADAVSQTLGPNGRNVILERVYNKSRITKDGVSVANEIFLEDRLANVGAQIAKEAAAKTVEEAGDGTTTSTIIMRELFNLLLELDSKYKMASIKKVIDEVLEVVIDEIKNTAHTIQEEQDLIRIATLSTNNDKELGEIIGKLVYRVGKNGKIFIEESKTGKTYSELLRGAVVEHSYIHPLFRTIYGDTAEFTNPLIVVTDLEYKQTSDLYDLIYLAAENKRDLILFASQLEREALDFVLENAKAQRVRVAVLRPPGVGNMKILMMEDLGVLLGCKVVFNNKGKKLKVNKEILGEAEKVIISPKETTIINGKGDKEKIEARISYIEETIKRAEKGIDERHRERLAMLFKGVARLYVGGYTEVEITEKKDRVEDAILATQSTFEMGYVVGGGILLAYLGSALIQKAKEEELPAYKREALVALGKSLLKPFETLVDNSTLPTKKVEKWFKNNMEKERFNLTIDFSTDTFVDGIERGIIDPAKVIVCACKNAVSTALMLATTSAVIHYKENIFNNAHMLHPDYANES